MSGIRTVCDLFGLTERAVRFYEERGLVEPARDRFNCRKYDARARARLQLIAEYRRVGLSIEDIQEILSLEPMGAAAQRTRATQTLRKRIAELDAARRQAESLIQRFASEEIVAVNSDSRLRVAGGAR